MGLLRNHGQTCRPSLDPLVCLHGVALVAVACKEEFGFFKAKLQMFGVDGSHPALSY